MPTDYSKLTIVHHPDPVLRRKAAVVRRFDEDLRRLAARMLELMREAPGVGLAAPQVGQSIRLFVANPTGEPQDDAVFVNPVLTQPFGELDDYEEGCLSLPGVRGTIRRPKGITVTAQDLQGKPFTLTSDQLAARVWQHETDHLDGVLILDRMSRIDKLANRRAVKELEGQ